MSKQELLTLIKEEINKVLENTDGISSDPVEESTLDEGMWDKLKRAIAPLMAAASISAGMGGTAKAEPVPATASASDASKVAKVTIVKVDDETKKVIYLLTKGRDTEKIRRDIQQSIKDAGLPVFNFSVSVDPAADSDISKVQGASAQDDKLKDPEKAESGTKVIDNKDGTFTATVPLKVRGNMDMAIASAESAALQAIMSQGGSGVKTANASIVNSKVDDKNKTVTVTYKIGDMKSAPIKEGKVTKKYLREMVEECMADVMNGMDSAPAAVSAKATDVDPDGYEGRMAKGNLFKIAKSASELHNAFQDNENLEPWVEEKIAVVAQMIDSVADYISYEKIAK